MPQKIYFYAPKSNTTGGYQILFARLIDNLRKISIYDLYLIDFNDGYVKSYLGAHGYKHVAFEQGKQIELHRHDILVANLALINELGNLFIFNPHTLLFFWELGPFSLIQRNMLMGNYYATTSLKRSKKISDILESKRKGRLAQFVKVASKNCGLVFMCGKNVHFNSLFFDVNFKANFLPIPVIVPSALYRNQAQPITPVSIRVGWLSRLAVRKTNPLRKLIAEIADYQKRNKNIKIELHVIGDGPYLDRLKNLTKEYSVLSAFPGRIEHDHLNYYIQKNIDIAFAMGTSALEFAKLGIPTLLTAGEITLNNDGDLPANYKWLYASGDYNLTSEPSLSCKDSLKPLDVILNNSHEFFEHGEKCYNYVITNHDMEIVTNQFMQYLERNTLTYELFNSIDIFKRDMEYNILCVYQYLKRCVKELIQNKWPIR